MGGLEEEIVPLAELRRKCALELALQIHEGKGSLSEVINTATKIAAFLAGEMPAVQS